MSWHPTEVAAEPGVAVTTLILAGQRGRPAYTGALGSTISSECLSPLAEKKKYPGNMFANDTWYFKTKKKFFETNISFQTTLKNYYEMGGNTLVLFSHFYQN